MAFVKGASAVSHPAGVDWLTVRVAGQGTSRVLPTLFVELLADQKSAAGAANKHWGCS